VCFPVNYRNKLPFIKFWKGIAMEISLITDEISADPETAFELGLSWGVRNFELRTMDNNRVPDLSEYQKSRIKELIEEYDVRIIAISPGLFKCPYPDKTRSRFSLQAFDYSLYQEWRTAGDLLKYHQEELLPASLAYAQELGAKIVVIFSFTRGQDLSGPVPEEVLETLQGAAVQAENMGLQLAIEVENHFWADTGEHTLDLLRRVNRPGLGVNWDPGNALEAGDLPFPAGYQAVRQYVRHVHFKDARKDSSQGFVYVIEGEVDWDGQIRALLDDRYAGFISVETHMHPRIRFAEASYRRLKRLIQSARV
jgi:sugar phosphate isomerase/epimerase